MKKKSLILTFLFLIFISGISIAYAAFTQRDYTHDSTIFLGDIKIKYKDNSNYINLSGALPESTSKGRNHNVDSSVVLNGTIYDVADNETVFAIDGLNTYRDPLYYRISLKYGDDITYPELEGFPTSNFRINDLCLKFDLIKYDLGGHEEYLLNNVRYSDLNNAIIYQGTFFPEIDKYLNYVYKLRVWVGEEANISFDSAGELGIGINLNENLLQYMYANFKITIESDFTSKEITHPFEYEILNYVEADNNQYIDTEYQITSDEIIYADFEMTESNSNRVSILGATNNSNHYGLDIENRILYSNIYGTPSELNNHLIKTKNKYNVLHGIDTQVCNLYKPSECDYATNTSPSSTINYGNLYLFKSSESQTNIFKGKIYNFAILDDSLNVVRDYIPVRNINGEIGLYELKTNEFYSSSSSLPLGGPQKKSIFVGNGTEDDPFLIRGKSDLNNLFSSIANLSNNGENIAYQNQYFLMTNDVAYDGIETAQVLGDNKFGGTFDGDGYKIINYKATGSKLGMFGTLDSGTIKNLVVENASITEQLGSTSDYTGGLSYKNISGYIYNVILDITITGNGTNIPIGILSGDSQYGSYENTYIYGEVSNNGTAKKYAISSGPCNTIKNIYVAPEIGSISTAVSYHYYRIVMMNTALTKEELEEFEENGKSLRANVVLLDETTNTLTMLHEMSRFNEFEE